MSKSFWTIFICLLVCIPFLGFTQAKDSIEFIYPYTNFTTLDGLASNETYDILQDSKGYIWISTDKGVSRYNGYEFYNFTTSDGLIDNTIFNLFEDSKGNVWFAGYNNKLGYWDGENFIKYKYNNLIQDYIAKFKKFKVVVVDLKVDSNQNVYLSLSKIGFIKIDTLGNSKTFLDQKKLLDQIESLNLENYYVHELDKDQFYYSYSNIIVNSNDLITNIIIENDSIIFISPLLSKTINYTNKTLNVFRDYPTNFISYYNVKDTLILSYTDFKFEQIKGKQEVSYEVTDLSFTNYVEKKIIVDENGVWIIKDNNRKRISKINIFEIVNFIIVDNNLWLTTRNKGVFLIQLDRQIKNLTIENFNTVAIFKEKNGISIQSEKLLKTNIFVDKHYNAKSKQIKAIFNELNQNYNFYGSVVFDNNQEKGINFRSLISNYYNFKIACTSTSIHIFQNDEEIKFHKLNSSIFSMLNYKDKILVGTQDGIIQLNKDLEIQKFQTNIPKIDSLRVQDLKKIDSTLIVATRGNGIFIINKDTSFNFNTKLQSNIINHLAINGNEIWVGTNHGVNILELKNNTLQLKSTITIEEGLTSQDVRQIFLNDSIMFLGCDNGISIVNKNYSSNPSVNIKIFLKSLTINDTLTIVPTKKNTTYSYYDNNIKFEFIGISPELKGQIVYRYKLEGLNNQWVQTENRSIQYNSIPAGEYNLLIQAKSENGDWTNEILDYSFTIEQAFWKSLWFSIATILLIITIISSIFSYYIITEKRKAQTLKEFDEFKQKALNAQMNPHFVYNSLNSIQNFILKSDKKEANKYLTNFSSLMRATFENSKKKYITLEEELDVLNNYLELESLRFENVFSYQFIIDPKIDNKSCLLPSLLIQPFLENAIWHGILHNAEVKGKIDIEMKLIKDDLKIIITDNGIGRIASSKVNHYFKDKKHESSGLEITQKRLELLNSIEDKNYTFKIVDLYNNKKEPLGTQVQFSIPYIIQK